MRGIHPDQLRAFADVIALGSFSAAAERLNLTQPAVSQQVRQLERRFGLRLIERIGRRATPTAAGLDLLAHARRIEEGVADAVAAMARHATGALGRVRIGTGATACIHVLPPVLRDLRQRFPTLELAVTTGSTAHILKLVDDNSLDVGLVTMPAAGRMLAVTPLLDDEFVVIAPRGASLPREVTARDLADRPTVLYEPGAQTRRIVDRWSAGARVALKPVMELGSVEAIKRLVDAGLGLGVLPGMAVADADSAGRFVIRPLAPRLSRQLALVLRRDKRLDRGLREVVGALTASAERGAPRPRACGHISREP